MSYLIYNENEKFTGHPAAIHRMNPNSQFRKHLENWFFLKLTLRNGDLVQKYQAGKELTICESKLHFWEKKSSFDMKQAERDVQELRNKWQEPDKLNWSGENP